MLRKKKLKTYKVPCKTHNGHTLVSRVNNVITCENYCKWYSLYYISKNDIVRTLENMFPLEVNNIEYIDHSWVPKSIVEFAIKRKLKIGKISYEAMVRMYAENFAGEYIPDKDLPSKEDYNKVIVFDYGDLSKCGFDYEEDSPLRTFDGRLYVK